jgi:hypothetical protein
MEALTKSWRVINWGNADDFDVLRNSGAYVSGKERAYLHKEELLAGWDLAQNGELPFAIDPLK